MTISPLAFLVRVLTGLHQTGHSRIVILAQVGPRNPLPPPPMPRALRESRVDCTDKLNEIFNCFTIAIYLLNFNDISWFRSWDWLGELWHMGSGHACCRTWSNIANRGQSEPQFGQSEPQLGQSELKLGHSETQFGQSETQLCQSEPQLGQSEPQLVKS